MIYLHSLFQIPVRNFSVIFIKYGYEGFRKNAIKTKSNKINLLFFLPEGGMRSFSISSKWIQNPG
jgi:hypothetical protein